LRFLPKDANQEDTALRPGTALASAKEALEKAGRPMHISEILKAINKPVDKKNRLSLSGSLASYVRNGQIFRRPAPNTFALIEAKGNANGESQEIDLPDEFGDDQ